MNDFRRLLSALSAWSGRSIRRQLALAFGGTALVLMLVFAALLFHQQQDFLYRTGNERANALAHALADSSTSWVLADDVAGLQEVVRGFADIPDMKRAFVLSRRGEVLGSTRPGEIGRYVTDPLSAQLLASPPKARILLADTTLIDAAVPVMAGDRHVGWARIELSQDSANANLRAVTRTGLGFALLATLASLVMALALAHRLTRRLHHLTGVASAVASGRRDVRANLGGDDEMATLVRDFNQMLDTLAASEQQLRLAGSVFENSIEGILITTPEGRILNVNRGFREILGYREDEVVDQDAGMLGSDLSGQEFVNRLREQVRESGRWQGEILARRQDGSVCPGWLTVTRVDDEAGQARNYVCVFADISDRKRAEEALAHERAMLRGVIDSVPDLIFFKDPDSVFLGSNRAFEHYAGCPEAEQIGKTDFDLFDRATAELHREKDRQTLAAGGPNRYEEWIAYPDGRRALMDTLKTPFHGTDGRMIGIVGISRDITERKQAEEQIHQLAFYDSLTGLPNRRLLIDRLRRAMAASRRNHRMGVLMLLDVDHFKTLNDTHGHDVGDLFLIEVSKRLLSCIREEDTVARLGGDEFVVMLENLKPDHDAASHAEAVGEKIRSTLAMPYHLEPGPGHADKPAVEHHATASIGISLFVDHDQTVDDLLKRADLAMYQAKQAGRDTIRFFDPEMQASLDTRSALEADLRRALTREELELHYQIQVDAADRPVGAEALLRWKHPQRGWLPPATFIPLAEQTGLILPIGQWVLEESCRTLAAWAKDPLTRDLRLAANISVRQFQQPNFVDQVKAALDHSGVDPSRLKLEITESLVLEDVTEAIARMQEIGELGVGFSMDDFGTGYSSLAYLQQLPLEQLKIDQSFVRDLADDGNNAAIVRTILSLGRSLELTVIAEGVETEAQRAYLATHGCPMFQGYLFGKPMPREDFEAEVRQAAASVAAGRPA